MMRVAQGVSPKGTQFWLILAGLCSLGIALPAEAEMKQQKEGTKNVSSEKVKAHPKSSLLAAPQIRSLNRPASTVKEWMAQIEARTVQVTSVTLNRTDTGLEIELQTAEGRTLQVDATKFRTEGNSLIADIPNAVLALPDSQTFTAENPTEEIATVQVVQQSANTLRVTVTGKDAPPREEVTLKTGEFAYSLNPEVDEADEEIVVTGEGERGYRARNATTGTKTDAPLRDVPQAIQVIPEQVLEDQQVTDLSEALRNAPGVSVGPNPPNRGFFALPRIRGFNAENDVLTDGLRDPNNAAFGFNPALIEQVEVLKGPASVLYGQGSIGGVVNLITKKPLTDPFYSVEATAGSFNFYRGIIDLSGPLNDNKTVAYRLIGSALTTESFVDFFDRQEYLVAPSLAWQIDDRTKLTLTTQYVSRPQNNGQDGLPAVGTVLFNPLGEIERDRSFSEPYSRNDLRAFRAGYDFEHRFSETWQIRSAFQATWLTREQENWVQPIRLNADNRTLVRAFADGERKTQNFNFDTYVVGNFSTGSIQHELVTGFNYLRRNNREVYSDDGLGPFIDVFNPVYNQPFERPGGGYEEEFGANAYGLYIQDRLTLTENLKLVLGGRFDITTQKSEDVLGGTSLSQQQEAFSPRVGIVYQPIQPISLYASYSRSFLPPLFTTFQEVAQPERGTQYEVGVKADLSERLAATLAFYDLTRSNVSTSDPNNPLRSIQVGEQRSRGLEFSLAGEILPGWNIIAGYALTDTEITKDNTFTIGNQINNIPKNSASLWTTYELQSGGLQGLGFGFGVFYVGDRQGDLANTFKLPSYVRADAAIFYRRDRFRVSLNFKNLFNTEYFDSALNRANVYPGEPFAVQGTVSFQF